MSASDSLLPPLTTEEIEGGAAAVEVLKTTSQRSLEGTALKATLWTAGSYGISQSLRLVNNWAVTHMLVPEYFGLMAIVSTITLGATLISDIGLLPGVIGSPRGDEPIFLDTAWTIQVVRGCLLWVIALVLTIPIAHLYHDSRLYLLIPIVAFSTVIDGFASSNLMTAARHIGVKRLLMIDLSSQIVTILITFGLAVATHSIWSLVGGSLAASVLKTSISHIPAILPGRRNSFAWEKDAVHSLVHFGKWIMLGTALYYLASQADRLILGKLISFRVLGVYIVAFTFADIPRQVIQQFSYRVGLPFIAKMTHLPMPEFRKNCLKYRFYALAAGSLILSLVVNFGGLIVSHIYDKRYVDTGWMIPILALGLWHTLMYATIGDILFALGKSKYNAIGTACFCVTMFTALPLAFHFYGLRGAIISVAAGDFPFYLVLTYGVWKEKVSVWRQDIYSTAMFLGFLGLGYFVKKLILG
jgi:O-antigen/teichoic acid export membrane protein